MGREGGQEVNGSVVDEGFSGGKLAAATATAKEAGRIYFGFNLVSIYIILCMYPF